LSQRRYQVGQQQVTSLIEGLRNSRRKMFDRLWIASIALTALSIVALAVELIQGTPSPNAKHAAIRDVNRADRPSSLAKTTAERRLQLVTPAVAREWSSETPQEQQVQSAHYTTEDEPKHKGAWLDGWIAPPESDSE
jgi:hypothetical protein